MFPDDLPLCGHCGLDELTHDHTMDHDFNAVCGGRIVPRMADPCPPSRLTVNGRAIIAWACLGWLVIGGLTLLSIWR